MSTMSERIKQLRKEFDITQKDMARELGVTNAHISRIEKGLTMPSDALIKLIAKLYEVSEPWLKTGEGPMMIYDLWDESDNNLDRSLKEFNKLLTDRNPIIRLKASQLDVVLCEITSVDYLDESDKITYLDMLIKLFNEINSLMTTFKQYAFDNQLCLLSSDLDKVLNYQLNNINCQFGDFKKFFLKTRNEVEIPRNNLDKKGT